MARTRPVPGGDRVSLVGAPDLDGGDRLSVVRSKRAAAERKCSLSSPSGPGRNRTTSPRGRRDRDPRDPASRRVVGRRGRRRRGRAAARGGAPSRPPSPVVKRHSALAGHRDTFFRRLGELRMGDEILFTTTHGRLSYRVRELMVVNPDAVWVLSPSAGADLTLITCYPFHYVGLAPHRFIVQATRSRVSDV